MRAHKIITSQLDVFETREYVVDVGISGLFSVKVDGAGSQLPPEMEAGNGSDFLYPLYSITEDESTVSLFYLKDPKLYWLYLQSNGMEDAGEFSLSIIDGETANLPSVNVNGSSIQQVIPPGQSVVYELQGVAENDLITIIAEYKDNNPPYFNVVSLDGEYSKSLYDIYRESDGDEFYIEVFRIAGKGPYRFVGESFYNQDVEFNVEIQSGDGLSEYKGAVSYGGQISESIPADEVVLWSIEGLKGQVVNLSFEIDESSRVEYRLLKDDGAYIAGDYLYGRNNAPVESGAIEFDENGEYTIALIGNGSNDTEVSFDLNLLDLPVAVNKMMQAEEEYSAPLVNNREDLWTFKGKAGEVITIRLTASLENTGINFSLIRPDGARVNSSYSYRGAGQLGPIVLPQTGNYIVSVTVDSSEMGEYAIILNPLSDYVPSLATGQPGVANNPSTQPTFSSSILLYEDSGNLEPWIQETMDSMGLQYTQVTRGAVGDLIGEINSSTDWDLIIISSESKDSNIQGDVWEAVLPRIVNDKSGLIAEIWNLDLIAGGKVTNLLEACGVEFQRDLLKDTFIYNLVPDHPIYNEPNDDISLLNYSNYWIKQAGDMIRLTSGGDATILAGLNESLTDANGVIAECMEGRMIIQTFSNHDYQEDMVKALWENYITYVLDNRSKIAP